MKKSYISFGFIILAVLIILLIKQSLTFHLVKTDPKNGSRPNQYTAVSFIFNQQIQPSGASLNQISITPSVGGQTKIDTKSVTFTPNAAFNTGTTYTAVLSEVINSKSKSLSNLKISFTPQYVEYSKLPKNIQQRLLSQTDTNDSKKSPYSASIIAIQGSSDLINHGVSSRQISSLQIAFFNFFQSKHTEVRGLSLSNIVKVPHNPNSASTIDTVNFTVTLDNKTIYRGRLDYSNLTTSRLYLYDPKTSSLIYDSGDINS